MPRFCANLSMLFPDLPLPQRIGAARAAGFEAVEILFPYEVNSAELLGPLRQTGLPLALINGPPPSYAGGPRGFAAIPGGQARFAADLRRALRYVDALGAQHLHLMAGVAEGPKARAAFVENLRHAVQTAPAQSFTIEPLNPADMPGYFLSDFDVAMDILDEIDAPNLHLQFDAYHAHRITGDVMGTWAKTRRRVAHVQIAGYPGRHEPTGGEIDYPEVFAMLDADGYDGWVSAEYNPKGDTVAGLGWLQ
ncbi:MAG: hydroxypyruvate isomerase [Rhodobacterales bacterium]|nr:MAG: hydroxypyruvate isomerase [Rhodobacterales bacterium]